MNYVIIIATLGDWILFYHCWKIPTRKRTAEEHLGFVVFGYFGLPFLFFSYIAICNILR